MIIRRRREPPTRDTADGGSTPAIIRALSYLVNAKDPHTYGHSTRVEHFAVELARELGLDPTTIRTIHRAALVHDVSGR